MQINKNFVRQVGDQPRSYNKWPYFAEKTNRLQDTLYTGPSVESLDIDFVTKYLVKS